ncbi:hypothetical protein NP493_222g03007 [Ridgeia piscesae]|uniref:Uncharacterized protein n=1 Tax=Ridgeia piscesae TaxID=27915 RepID=A0AAD9P0D3_RIDPI|nr:hypothetical protein NP493_222g03007 [Ridgeia piscesae]
MYLPTKMCPSRPYTESFTWWIHAGLVEGYRESYRCIPAIRWNFRALSGEHKIWDNTQHLLTAALTNYQLICE